MTDTATRKTDTQREKDTDTDRKVNRYRKTKQTDEEHGRKDRVTDGERLSIFNEPPAIKPVVTVRWVWERGEGEEV